MGNFGDRPDALSEEMQYEHWDDCDRLRLWPMPRNVTHGERALSLSPKLTLTVSHPALMAVGKKLLQLARNTSCPKGEISNFTIIMADPQVPSLESYSLRVDGGRVTIRAQSELGVGHAWRTLRQILRLATYSDCWLVMGVPLAIDDEPQYAYRGLMLDTSRERLSLDWIRNLTIVMAATKLNVLHWQMHDEISIQSAMQRPTEDPDDTESVLYGSGYELADLEKLVTEAASLGITVVPGLPLPNVWPLGVHCEGDACDSTAWAIVLDNDVKSTLTVYVEQYLERLSRVFSSASRPAGFTGALALSQSALFIHFARPARTLPCWNYVPFERWTQSTNRTLPPIASLFSAQLAQLLRKADVVPLLPYEREMNATARLAEADSEFLGPAPLARWSLPRGCMHWRTCYAADVLNEAQQNLGGQTELWGGEVVASHTKETAFRAFNGWLRLLAVAERLWGRTEPVDAPQRLHYLCKRLALDGLLPWTACDIAGATAPRDDVGPAAVNTGACSLLPRQ